MKKPYKLTDKAGEFVAGRRIIGQQREDALSGDKPILLTDAEAAYEKQIGAISPVTPSVPVDEPQSPVKAKGAK